MYAIRSYYDLGIALIKRLSDPYHANEMTFSLGASIGISRFPEDASAVDEFVITSYSIHYTKLYEFLARLGLPRVSRTAFVDERGGETFDLAGRIRKRMLRARETSAPRFEGQNARSLLAHS